MRPRMQNTGSSSKGLLILLLALCSGGLAAQEAPSGTPPPSFMAAFPSRPKADAEVVARGREIYKTNCAYCHGEDARGGNSGGNNLLRTDTVMKDQHGELLRQFLLNASGSEHVAAREGILKFAFTSEQAADIAAFIHAFRL